MSPTPDLLAAIVGATRQIVETRRTREPAAAVARRAEARQPRGALFESRLSRPDAVNIIAECKRRSPSKGVLAASYDPVALARAYQQGGAAAISVLTEPTFFDGALEHVAAVRAAVDVPLLRKDFIVDEYQLLEARAVGADAVLLIVAALDQPTLERLQHRAWDLGLATLVEVHDDEELSRAVASGARVIGVNNRNLRTLRVDVAASDRLAAAMPRHVTGVSESGLQSRSDLERLAAAGYRAFLIGERFMTDPDPAGALRALISADGVGVGGDIVRGRDQAGGVFIKVCGLRRPEDVACAVQHGATAVGFIFWPRSPRYVDPEEAAALVRLVPQGVATVGVFVNEPVEAMRDIAARTGVSMVQLHGDEAPAVAAQLDRPVLKALGVEAVRDTAWPVETVVLLDVTDRERRGGTGRLVDWTTAAEVARVRPVVLAGGLTPENVEAAIAAVRPHGVDVSSGVEEAPGVKSAERVRLFLERARGAFERGRRR